MNEVRRNIQLHCAGGSLDHFSTYAFLASFRRALLAPPHLAGLLMGQHSSHLIILWLCSLAGNVCLLSVDITPFGCQLYDHWSTYVN